MKVILDECLPKRLIYELPRLQKKHRHQTRNKPLEDDLHKLLTGLGFQETLKKKLKARG